MADRAQESAATIYQALIEAELTSVIGAEPHERTDARTGQRTGHRPRVLSTTAGDLDLRIPKLRAGSFFPSLLERRRRVDQALYAVVMAAYLHGVSDQEGRRPGPRTGGRHGNFQVGGLTHMWRTSTRRWPRSAAAP